MKILGSLICKICRNSNKLIKKNYYFKQKNELSYFHAKSDYTLIGKTIGELLYERTEKHPDKEAAIFSTEGARLKFSDLKEKAKKLATGLLSLGINKGDRVGIWSPNREEWIITQYATALAGIILVNINPAFQASELEYALKKVDVKALIIADEYKSQNFYNVFSSICPEINFCQPERLLSKALPKLNVIIVLSDELHAGALNYNEVIKAGNSEHLQKLEEIQKTLQFDDPINIQFTSGTTGSPKGATLTHHNIVNNSYFVGLHMNYHKEDNSRIVLPVPLYHCFGMVLGSLMNVTHGTTVVYPSQTFEAEATLKAIDNEKGTSLYGTPTMFIDILNSPDFSKYNVTSLYTGIMAGSSCPVEILKKTINDLNMKDVVVCYGSTETSPVTFMSKMDDNLQLRIETLGSPLDHTEVKVVDDEGHIVPFNATGELCTRGYTTMLGYWQDPDRTADCIDSGRWYKTGDLVTLDENGYAKISGRKKDMLIRGGENIYPVEIEQFLYQFPKIQDVQIVGVPDKRMGEEICAWVKLRNGENCSEEEIKEFCKMKISNFKIPRYILFVEEFPMTVTGKVQKYKMKSESIKMLKLK